MFILKLFGGRILGSFSDVSLNQGWTSFEKAEKEDKENKWHPVNKAPIRAPIPTLFLGFNPSPSLS